MPDTPGSNTITDGIRVTVRPEYLPAQSDPGARRYIFAYHIIIANEGERTATLQSRRWIIINAHGNRRDVEGPGVVGHFPRLEPGEEHHYSSYCPLDTPWGTMEGAYIMQRDDGSTFDAEIGRFFLVAETASKAEAKTRAR